MAGRTLQINVRFAPQKSGQPAKSGAMRNLPDTLRRVIQITAGAENSGISVR
jgi:hypothetical protein